MVYLHLYDGTKEILFFNPKPRYIRETDAELLSKP